MRVYALMCAAVIAAVPASARLAAFEIELIPGHPIHHESEKKAGVAMALMIAPGHDGETSLRTLCDELRTAAGLASENGDELRLETLFVVPYKGMAVEGYYWPKDGTFGTSALVRGSSVARGTLDDILARAGVPPRILDETDVEQEISCQTGEPLWHVVWHDVRPIGDEEPESVIERAHDRFLAIHQSVVEHDARRQAVQRPGVAPAG